ncbi:MAG: EAL domain-containing protein [Rhodospirillaceae bacterium]|nr:EAL domain-containing protein [Rhodospirillaceae bacterium]
MFRSFQTKLILFSWLLFVGVEVVTFTLVQNVIRTNILEQARNELVVTKRVVDSRITSTVDTLAEGSAILARDFGFRQAVASDDRPTIRSALHNLGARYRADRMLLVSLENKVLVDTGTMADAVESGNFVTVGKPGAPFAYPEMIENAEADGRAAATTTLDNRIYQLVVVPILAPDPIAWIVVAMERGNLFASDLQHSSTVPVEITEAIRENGAWKTTATTLPAETAADFLTSLPEKIEPQPAPYTVRLHDADYVTLTAALAGPSGTSQVHAILQYSLDDAYAPYRRLNIFLLLVAGAALALSLLGSVLIARRIAGPIRTLDLAAQRIYAGRYDEKVTVHQNDEIGRLSETFNRMMEGIAEREERIAFQARHDASSGLPNRISFEGHVADMIAARQKMPAAAGQVFSVILVQIGRFSELNNTLGHDTGEQLIRKVAKNLQRLVPQTNAVARHSNNMFALVLDISDGREVQAAVTRILDLFDKPFTLAGLAIDITAVVGEARHPEHGTTARALIQHADTAIFEAKRRGANCALYNPELDPHKPERLSVMGELRQGLDEGQFRLYYQPKIDIARGAITAVEALIRWMHPKHGFMPPDSFIPLAEQTGNIRKLTDWVLGAAVRQARAWADKGIDVKIACNLSARDLSNRELPGDIGNLLDAHGVAPSALILEITESAVMQDPTHALEVLAQLHRMGLTLSIDDYGTGYSSMAYLKRLPVHEIKIDKSFVLNLASNRGDAILVKSTIELGHALGLKVTAEGIEDEESLKILSVYGCGTGQGYFISKPIPAEDFETFYAVSRWSPRAGQGPGSRGPIAAAGE